MATTIEYPMELDIVNPTNGNAGWVNQNGPLWYSGRYRFNRYGNPGMPSGEGLMTFKSNIPKNIASPTNWNIVLEHMSASGSPGAVLIHIAARSLASGDTPSNPVILVPNKLLGVGTSGDMNISTMAGLAGVSSFDSALTLAAGTFLEVVMRREPLNTSGDTLQGGWDLLIPPIIRIDVV